VTNDTTILLGLDGLAAERVEVDPGGVPVVHVVTADADAPRCPSCRAPSSSPKQWVTSSPRDLPHGGRGVRLVWRKRRWRCRNPDCARGSFTEQVAAVPARSRLTTRLRAASGAAVADRGATVVQAGRDLDLSWPTVWAAFTAHAGRVLAAQPDPVRVLGIDETYRGRRRWRQDPVSGRGEPVTDRWHVGFVDADGGQGLLGQVEGRTSATVSAWLQARPAAWREAVRYVAIDMSTIFLTAIRQVLPAARIVVDHFHVVQLANQAITEVRRRVTFTMRGRRGRASDGEWRVRHLLTRNHENLTERRFAKMWNTLIDLGDPGYDILAAYVAKEKLRDLLALARTQPDRRKISASLYDFYHWCAHTDLPEVKRLATTIEQWWPHIAEFIHTGISNATSEGINRVVKLEARKAYGFRNPENQRLRIRCATTRRTRGHLQPA